MNVPPVFSPAMIFCLIKCVIRVKQTASCVVFERESLSQRSSALIGAAGWYDAPTTVTNQIKKRKKIISFYENPNRRHIVFHAADNSDVCTVNYYVCAAILHWSLKQGFRHSHNPNLSHLNVPIVQRVHALIYVFLLIYSPDRKT